MLCEKKKKKKNGTSKDSTIVSFYCSHYAFIVLKTTVEQQILKICITENNYDNVRGRNFDALALDR